MTPALFFWLWCCCQSYGVEPEFALAVAHVESGTRTQEYRVGRLGHSRYYGPMGIDRDFLRKWRIDDPYENIRRGVPALRGRDKLPVLRRYNRESNRAYERAVMAKYQELQDRTVKGRANAH